MFDLHEFIEVVFPVILKQAIKNYYVKGGRVYDFYFKNKTGSIDWDIIGTDKFRIYIEKTLQDYASKFGLTLIHNLIPQERSLFGYEMYQYGFRNYFYSDDKDPYFIDIVVHNSISPKEYIQIGSINYITLEEFIKDLIITQRNRYNIVKNYMHGELDIAISRFNRKYHTNIKEKNGDVFTQSIFVIDSYIQKKTKKYPQVREVLENTIIVPLRSLSQNTDKLSFDSIQEQLKKIFIDSDPQTELEELSASEEDEDELNDLIDGILSDYYTDILLEVFSEESPLSYSKFLKTRDRYKNVIDISWENLSIEYKRYLIEKCEKNDYLDLFSISDTCRGYLICASKKIDKKTSRCISDRDKIEFGRTELYIKNKIRKK